MRYKEDCNKVGKEPSISEIAAFFGESEETVTEAISCAQPAISLTETEENGSEFDIPVEAPQVKATELIALKQCLGYLSGEERELIYLRYWKGKTQSETGKMMNMTQVQVSRKEKKILSRLREMLV